MKNTKMSLKLFIIALLFTTQFINASAQYQQAAAIQKATIENFFDIKIGDNYSKLENILLLSTCYGFAQEQISVSKDKTNDDDILNSRNVYAPGTVNVPDTKDTLFFPQQKFDGFQRKNKDDNENDIYETILLHD